jgi:hypothetical protein
MSIALRYFDKPLVNSLTTSLAGCGHDSGRHSISQVEEKKNVSYLAFSRPVSSPRPLSSGLITKLPSCGRPIGSISYRKTSPKVYIECTRTNVPPQTRRAYRRDMKAKKGHQIIPGWALHP